MKKDYASMMVGKISGKTLKCECGKPRFRGTQLCPSCTKDTIAASAAEKSARMRD